MYEEKASTSIEDFKDEFDQEPDEEKPPNLAPPAPPPRFRLAVANFTRPGVPMNDRRHASYDRHVNYSSVERYNEEVAMRFLFGNGKPLSTIDDEHFLTFLHYLNSTRPPPEVKNMVTRSMTEYRPDIKYLRNNGPLCVTIEAIRKSDEIYLSLSAHHYNQRGERQNSVHFEKVILADYEGRIVADRIRKVVDSTKCHNFRVAYILSPNIRMLSLVSDSMPFKNKFVCFFSYLTNIAREAVSIPEFSNGLKTLRAYVEALHKHQEVFSKFRKIQMDSGSNVDIPPLDSDSDWLSTLNFLSTCSLLNKTFSSIHENWCMPPYLDAAQENAMASLHELLSMFCLVASQLCSEDSCVSQVYYSMSIINNAIGHCGIKNAREALRKTFTKYYNSISNGKVGDFYAIAALLDPRYGLSRMIFSENDWENVEIKLYKKMETENHNRFTVQQELKIYKKLIAPPPSFDEVNTHVTWWNDHNEELPTLYRQWIEYSTVPAVSIDGKTFFGKGGKFAHLFATLEEELHLKAMLLAQSSQEFIGRGSSSTIIQNRVAETGNHFKQLDREADEMEVDPPQHAEVDVKQEIPDDSEGMQEHGPHDVKEEEPDDYPS